MQGDVFTVGHSNQTAERFVQLLNQHGITAIADVRSTPYSRHNQQFNRDELKATLKAEGIRYVFLGKELGARSDDDCCYVNDKVQYELLARTELFQSGVSRVIEGAVSHRIALLCAEKDPLDCHRTILVARELVNRGCTVTHILASGLLEAHADALSRLVKRLGFGEEDMFRSNALAVEQAYQMQGQMIAYDRKAHRASADGNQPFAFIESEHQ